MKKTKKARRRAIKKQPLKQPLEAMILDPAHLALKTKPSDLDPRAVREHLNMHWQSLQTTLREFRGDVGPDELLAELAGMIQSATQLAVILEHHRRREDPVEELFTPRASGHQVP